MNSADSTDVRQTPEVKLIRLSRRIPICVSLAFNKRLGTVQLLAPASCRGPRLWRGGIKSPIARLEELAGGSWRRGTTEQAERHDAVSGDPGRRVRCIKGWRCGAVQCLVGLRGAAVSIPLAVIVVGEDGETDRQTDRQRQTMNSDQ